MIFLVYIMSNLSDESRGLRIPEVMYEIFMLCDIKSALNLSATCTSYRFDYTDRECDLYGLAKLLTYDAETVKRWVKKHVVHPDLLDSLGLCTCGSPARFSIDYTAWCNQCSLKDDPCMHNLILNRKCFHCDTYITTCKDCDIYFDEETDVCTGCGGDICYRCSVNGMCSECFAPEYCSICSNYLDSKFVKYRDDALCYECCCSQARLWL